MYYASRYMCMLASISITIVVWAFDSIFSNICWTDRDLLHIYHARMQFFKQLSANSNDLDTTYLTVPDSAAHHVSSQEHAFTTGTWSKKAPGLRHLAHARPEPILVTLASNTPSKNLRKPRSTTDHTSSLSSSSSSQTRALLEVSPTSSSSDW